MNLPPTDNSHETSSLVLQKMKRDNTKSVVCCSHDWPFKEQ